MRWWGARTVAATVAVVCALTACSDGGSAPSSDATTRPTRTVTLEPEGLPPGVGISFIQQRLDEGTRRAQVRVVNGTGEALSVRGVGLDWPGFPGNVQAADTSVAPGQVLDVRYELPEPDCSASAGATAMRGVVVTSRGTLHRPMGEDGQRFLERLWRTECDARLVARSVDLSFDVPRGLPSGSAAEGLDTIGRVSLVLTRPSNGAGEPVAVDEVQGSVLFELAIAGGDALPVGQAAGSVPLDIGPGRCDEHGRSQSTQTFTWRVWVTIGDGEPIAVVLSPTPPQQRSLLAWLDRACGEATATS